MHILHDNTLTADNRDKFSYIAGQYGQLVKFYNVEKLCADKIAEMIELVPDIKTARVSIGAFYRLISPQIFSPDIEKVIYFDSDIIVNLDIEELWSVRLGDKPLAAVPVNFNGAGAQKVFYICQSGFVKYKNYFNSGVLIMNLKHLRTKTDLILKGVQFRGDHPECDYFDQDILNYCFSTQYVKLPVKFNRYVKSARPENETTINKKIYHYAGDSVGLGLNMSDPFNRLWMKYFMRTPWFDAEAIGRLYDGVQQLNIGLKQSMANISAMMSGKTRAFFIAPQNVNAVKKIFSIRDDEEIILVENQTSLKKLLDGMNASRGKKVFFIMLPGFPFQMLIQAGFKYGRDFVNGFDFLSEAHGLPLNSYPLIKAM